MTGDIGCYTWRACRRFRPWTTTVDMGPGPMAHGFELALADTGASSHRRRHRGSQRSPIRAQARSSPRCVQPRRRHGVRSSTEPHHRHDGAARAIPSTA
ncbi:MAG: hypothetical protein ACLTDR_01080 [Adlercreutzia equolifaciens]